jgi:hypothetical protein
MNGIAKWRWPILGGLPFGFLVWTLRLDGLGERSLAWDEYYFAQSVGQILEQGVPAFETGGYYPRGLPLQYANAAICHIMGESETAQRASRDPVKLRVLFNQHDW